MPRLPRVKTKGYLRWIDRRLVLQSDGAVPFISSALATTEKREAGWVISYLFSNKTHFSPTREGAISIAETQTRNYLFSICNRGRHTVHLDILGKF